MIDINTDDWITIRKSLSVLSNTFRKEEYLSFIQYGFGQETIDEIPNYDVMELHELFIASLLKLHSITIKDEEYLTAKLITEVVEKQMDIIEDYFIDTVYPDDYQEYQEWLDAVRDYISMVFINNVTHK